MRPIQPIIPFPVVILWPNRVQNSRSLLFFRGSFSCSNVDWSTTAAAVIADGWMVVTLFPSKIWMVGWLGEWTAEDRAAITLKLEASCGGEGLLFSREKRSQASSLSSLGIWHASGGSIIAWSIANDDDCCRFTAPERDSGTGNAFPNAFVSPSLALHIRCSCRFGFPPSAVGAIKELGDGLLCVTSEGGRRRNGEMVRTMR